MKYGTPAAGSLTNFSVTVMVVDGVDSVREGEYLNTMSCDVQVLYSREDDMGKIFSSIGDSLIVGQINPIPPADKGHFDYEACSIGQPGELEGSSNIRGDAILRPLQQATTYFNVSRIIVPLVDLSPAAQAF